MEKELAGQDIGIIEKLKEKAEQLLEQKYSEKMWVENYCGKQLLNDYYTVSVVSDEFPDLPFEAYVDYEKNLVYDTYVSKRVCLRISDTIANNLKTIKGYIYVFTRPMIDNDQLDNPNMTIESFMASSPKNKLYVNVFIYLEDGELNNLYENVVEMFKGLEVIFGKVTVYLLTKQDELGEIQEYFQSNTNIYYDFKTIVSDMRTVTFEFEKGTVNISKEDLIAKVG